MHAEFFFRIICRIACDMDWISAVGTDLVHLRPLFYNFHRFKKFQPFAVRIRPLETVQSSDRIAHF